MSDDFTYFVHAHWRPLVRAAVFLGCSSPEAEDVAQTTLTKVHRAWSRVESAADPTAYTFRILLDTLSRSPEREAVAAPPSLLDGIPGDPLAGVDRRDELLRLLDQLPREQREVLVLRHVADLSEAQTAEVLGIAPQAVTTLATLGMATCTRLHEEAR